MRPRRASFTAWAPPSLERYPHLPLAHRQVLRARHNCPRGPYGHRLYPCHHCGGPPRVPHAWGHRHGPPWPPQNTPPWLQHPLAQHLPGPPGLLTVTGPEPLRPCLRSHQRFASQALLPASATALKRLATAARFMGTALPGGPGVLPTWGRPLPYHPHLHSLVPGGGLAKDRPTWLPSRAHCLGPVTALAPLSRALFKEERRPAGLLAPLAPQRWTLPWNVHAQATPHGSSAFPSLAPSVCTVALSHHRLVRLTDRTVTCTSRHVGRARRRTAPLDVMALLRRFLQPVLPDGFVTVRPCGGLHARCAVPRAAIPRLMEQGHPRHDPPTPRTPSPLRVPRCPTCGTPMRVVMRLWTSHRDVGDTG
jgi:hypothetical protein